MVAKLLESGDRADQLVSARHPAGPVDCQVQIFAVSPDGHLHTLDQMPHDRLAIRGLRARRLPEGRQVGAQARMAARSSAVSGLGWRRRNAS